MKNNAVKSFYLSDIEKDHTRLTELINTDAEKIEIYIDSQGGDCHISEMIIDIINKNSERIQLNIIGYAFSMAFFIFFSCDKCLRSFGINALGMFHLPYRDYSLKENGKMYDKTDIVILKNNKKIYNHTINFCKNIGMNKEEIAKIKKGEDVFFDKERMQELINYKKNI